MASDRKLHADRTRPSAPLIFGIPQLDELMGYQEGEYTQATRNKINEIFGSLYGTTSLTILGEDGTGKSVVALHLASSYAALHHRHRIEVPQDSPDNISATNIPLIVYVSTDFDYSAASKVWQNFYLDYPWLRYVSSITRDEHRFRADELIRLRSGQHLHIDFTECAPNDLIATMQKRRLRNASVSLDRVYFVDLARRSTGDDWRFISSLMAAVPRLKSSGPMAASDYAHAPHLLIIDSVAGLETLVGRTNRFGQESSRRSRITRALNAAGKSWHLVLVSEEPENVHHHPEEYVTATVLHLKRSGSEEKVRRILEIEKSRAREIIPGEHYFDIRDGSGSSTQSWENPDDPHARLHPDVLQKLKVELVRENRKPYNSYIQVFPSLHYLSKAYGGRRMLASEAVVDRLQRLESNQQPVMPFDLEYLDNLLAVNASTMGGLSGASVTALIGEEGTRKVTLAEQFLIAGYTDVALLTNMFITLASQYRKRRNPPVTFSQFVQGQGSVTLDELVKASKVKCDSARLADRLAHFGEGLHDTQVLNKYARSLFRLRAPTADAAPLKNRWSLETYLAPVEKDSKSVKVQEGESVLALGLSALRLLTGTVSPTVFIATHDLSREALVARILHRYESDIMSHVQCYVGSQPATLKKYRYHVGRVLEAWVTVRRIELVDVTSPQLWQIIESCAKAGIHALGYSLPTITYEPSPRRFAEHVRVVISDLRLLRDTYPDVAADPLFLPTVVFRLKRLGVTTLIVESENGRLDQLPTNPMSGALRSLVDQQINTWKVNFFGEQRVAIAVLPSSTVSEACLIRELRYEKREGHDLARVPVVDPTFETFENIESGNARAVQLQIHMYDETLAFRKYFESEQRAIDLIFAPESTNPCVVKLSGATDYLALRDFAHLRGNHKLPFTLVFMVDGHWALGQRNALKNQHSYLFKSLPSPMERHRFEDPFRLFVPTGADSDETQCVSRADLFAQEKLEYEDGYRHRIDQNRFADVDRVPFMWDFGFLLCNVNQWLRAGDIVLKQSSSARRRLTVLDIFRMLSKPQQIERHIGRSVTGKVRVNRAAIVTDRKASARVSWRQFFEACKLVAEKEGARTQTPCRAFDVVNTSAESLTCMFLEIWLSEVYDDIWQFTHCKKTPSGRLNDDLKTWSNEARERLYAMSSRYYDPDAAAKPCLEEMIKVDLKALGGSTDVGIQWEKYYGIPSRPDKKWTGKQLEVGRRFCLIKGTGGYSLQLYQTWLLLLEVLDCESFLRSESADGSKGDRHDTAVAVRHWYKTACEKRSRVPEWQGNTEVPVETEIPVRVPGHFSARGDWFLAAAAGSRSGRLAEKAIDFLCSRRGNRTRLQLGLGLPVRDLIAGEALRSIRTGLTVATETGMFALSYGSVLELGSHFLSGSKARMAARDCFWLFRTGLRNYDLQATVITRWIEKLFSWTIALRFDEAHHWEGGFRAYDDLRRGRVEVVKSGKYKSWSQFFDYLSVFRADLIAAVQSSSQRSDSKDPRNSQI